MASRDRRQIQRSERAKKDAGREKANRTINADMNSGGHSNSRSVAVNHEAGVGNPRNTSQSLAQSTTGNASSGNTDVFKSASHDNEHAYDIAKMIARLDVSGTYPNYPGYATGGASDWSMVVHNDAYSASGFPADNTNCVGERTWSESAAERNLLMEHDLLGLGAQFK